MSACTHPTTDTCSSCWCSECDDYIVNVSDGPDYSADEHWQEHVEDRREREEERAWLCGDGEPRWRW